MKRTILAVFLLAGSSFAEGVALSRAEVDLGDEASLQRGARTFVNYCLSCHSAAYMRFSRIAQDLHVSKPQMIENLMFVTDKLGDTMQVAMQAREAEAWFGIAPPDLSVIARSRGADWLYTYLTVFYLDPARPTGVNNLVLKDTAMPHVLWELQGWQKPVKRTVAQDGHEREVIERLESSAPGKLGNAEYRRLVNDLVSFLVYMGEPSKLMRQRLGIGVLSFLSVALVVMYLLQKEFWKDVR